MAVRRKCTKLASKLVEFQNHFGSMPDSDCQWAIENPKKAIELFIESVKNRSENLITSTFPIWKTIEVGGMTSDELLEAMQSMSISVAGWAKDIMSTPAFVTSKEKRLLNLTRCKVRDLGFTSSPKNTQFLMRIRDVGKLCPAATGPHLRLKYVDQPNNEDYLLAMRQIVDCRRIPRVFSVGRSDDGRRWLYGRYADDDCHWSLNEQVVFVLR